MTDMTIINTQTWDLSIAQLAALPQAELQHIDTQLNELIHWTKKARERLNAAIEGRYSEEAKSLRLLAGKDFGVVHLSDGPLRVTVDLPKRVSWDQAKLAAIARRIADSGERVEDYLDVEYSVSESRFNHWPPALKSEFEDARTVKPGKPSFRLALVGDAY